MSEASNTEWDDISTEDTKCNEVTPFSQESNVSYSSRSNASNNSHPIINLCSLDEEFRTKVTRKTSSSSKPSMLSGEE
jgi:hypothetical protein